MRDCLEWKKLVENTQLHCCITSHHLPSQLIRSHASNLTITSSINTTPHRTTPLSHTPLHLSSPQLTVHSLRYDPRVVSDLDPPGDLFRAQLVCEALNTCGAYYVRGQAKERLSRYLVYFQRYLLSKPLLPTHIEFAILDTFDNLEELARSAAIASAVKAKSSQPAMKVTHCCTALLCFLVGQCCFVYCCALAEKYFRFMTESIV